MKIMKIQSKKNNKKQQNKTNYDTRISEIQKKLTDHNDDKFITTLEFNKFTAEIFSARLA